MPSGSRSDASNQAMTKVLADAMRGISRQLDELNVAVRNLVDGIAADSPGSSEVMALVIRAEASAAALAAAIRVISTFASGGFSRQAVLAQPEEPPVLAPPTPAVEERIKTAAPRPAVSPPPEELELEIVHLPSEEVSVPEPAETAAEPLPVQEQFDMGRLSAEEQDLHRRAQKFARVAVQDILLYKRDQVNQGRKNKDLYNRLKDEIDKSREIYERRFARITHHPIDHFYNEVLSVLAEGDPAALGHYPYPLPAARR